MRLGLLAVTALVAAGCSVPGLGGSVAGSSAPTAASGASARSTSSGSPAVGQVCASPSKEMLAWAADAVASHPGPVTRAASVFAATSDTGTWYVLAVERAYVHDDGSAAEGRSRSLALVNAAATGTGAAHMIDIGRGPKSGDVAPDWHRVSWAGATLDAGRRAAAAAIACLDVRSR